MKQHPEQQYLDLCRHVLKNGVRKEDRTGTGTLSVFGHQMRFDMADGFPLLTTKAVKYDTLVLGELLAFIAGETNANVIADKFKFKIWRKWADETGELGPIYGKQWRSWPHYEFAEEGKSPFAFRWRVKQIDQLAQVIEQIKTNPDSRRHIVSAWNVGQLDQMKLPPCHMVFQFYVANGKLSLQLYQRSADIFLGVPFNIASYATLLHMVAKLTDLEPGEFVHTLGDAHIYLDHIEQVKEQLKREPKPLPMLHVYKKRSIDCYGFDDVKLIGYEPHPEIKAKVSV